MITYKLRCESDLRGEDAPEILRFAQDDTSQAVILSEAKDLADLWVITRMRSVDVRGNIGLMGL